MYKIIILIINLLIINSTIASQPAIENFSRYGQYRNVIISPTGEYLAVEMVTKEGKGIVAILDRKKLEIISYIPATGKSSPVNPIWINDTRLVVSFSYDSKNRDAEYWTGELLAFNYDGTVKRKIISKASNLSNGKSKRLNNLFGHANIAHILPDDKKNILIRLTPWGQNKNGEKSKIYKINTHTGKIKLVAGSPSNYSQYVFSASGELSYSIGLDKELADDKNESVIHQFTNKEWQKLNKLDLDADQYRVIAVTKNVNQVYIESAYKNSTDKVYLYDLTTGKKNLVFHHPKVDPSHYSFDINTNDLLSVYFDLDYPDVQIINDEHPRSKWLPQLFGLFNGDTVDITSSTKDNELMVVKVQGAQTPKQFHLFNSKNKSIDYLLNSQSWIVPQEMAEVKPIELTARDGLKLHGYFTMPKNKNKDIPLIVMPHGGPHGPRDFWRYDPTVQFLASRGYAVLQVNFRGSGGYGLGFEKMGHRQWGNKIQLDIIDATHWAQKQQNIAKDKTCILGASFGGYSALMAPTIAPESYQCAIGFVGVYDLALLYEEGDLSTIRMGKNYLSEVLGADEIELTKYSPVAQVEKLQLPVLLIHGEKDHRADFKHFEVMKAALEKHDKDFDSLVFEKEGHGLGSEKNRAIYFRKVEKFLLKSSPERCSQ